VHALTVKQPWAAAIVGYGKRVENRSWRPPEHLRGQRIAIHVAQTRDDWEACWDAGTTNPGDQAPHLLPLLRWAVDRRRDHVRSRVPAAGCVVGTARLAGWVFKGEDGRVDWAGIDADPARELLESPWFFGPFGWVLADVQTLRTPLGPVRGALGCWSLPPEISEQLQAR
jgi:hypothetical protein